MVDLACVIHVHSTFSDGTATVPEIVDSASAAGADAVLLTDHDSLEAARQGLEGWHGDVLLLVGHEVTSRRGHLLAFGLEHEVDHRGLSEAEIYAEVDACGGFGFAAHPFSRGGAVPSIIRAHPWSEIERCGGLGIELWSLLTDAAERWRSPIAPLRFLRDPKASLDGPRAEHLLEWDRLCATRRVPAIGGLDAHQSGIRVRDTVLTPMSNERYFRLLRTHVLLDAPPMRELAADRDAIYGALREGRCYLGVDAFAPTDGFEFSGHDGRGKMVPMGSEVARGRWTLQASAPRPAVLRLLHDGCPVAGTCSRSLQHEVAEPGSYRVQAWLTEDGRERPWIISNPIYLR